jgi:hypothetical protein
MLVVRWYREARLRSHHHQHHRELLVDLEDRAQQVHHAGRRNTD